MGIMFILRIILVVLLCIPIWELLYFLYKKLVNEYKRIQISKRKENYEQRTVNNSRGDRWRR